MQSLLDNHREGEARVSLEGEAAGLLHVVETIDLGILSEIERLQALVIEGNPFLKGYRRKQLQALLASTGLQDYSQLTYLYSQLHAIPQPTDFPSVQEFEHNLSLYQQREGKDVTISQRPTTVEVAGKGWTHISKLQTRGAENIVHYLHDLGKVFYDPNFYTANFTFRADGIAIQSNGEISNGRHRGAALGGIGAARVRNVGISVPIKLAS